MQILFSAAREFTSDFKNQPDLDQKYDEQKQICQMVCRTVAAGGAGIARRLFLAATPAAGRLNLFTGCKRLGKPPGIVVAD